MAQEYLPAPSNIRLADLMKDVYKRQSLGNVEIHWVGERCIRGETVAQAAVECIEVRMPE